MGSDDGPPRGPGPPGRSLLLLLSLLPRNALSRWAGRIASLRLPASLQRVEIRLFAWLVGVDLAEARDPVASYPSLQAFFTRHLREGARPIAGDAGSLVAPCDGCWGASGRIERGTLLQVKGRRYRVERLLGDAERAAAYEGGWFATFYLSPRDYHRFHTPFAGRIERVDHRPGSLWPVNGIGLVGIDELFARNERLCAYLVPDAVPGPPPGHAPGTCSGGAPGKATEPIVLVAIGATMVGSVRLRFDDLRTNVKGGRAVRRDYGERAPVLARGEEWGHFAFGSTIVMLLPPDRWILDAQAEGEPLRLGEVIGRRRD
jgi:phosphatidylserine decarboxylase